MQIEHFILTKSNDCYEKIYASVCRPSSDKPTYETTISCDHKIGLILIVSMIVEIHIPVLVQVFIKLTFTYRFLSIPVSILLADTNLIPNQLMSLVTEISCSVTEGSSSECHSTIWNVLKWSTANS